MPSAQSAVSRSSGVNWKWIWRGGIAFVVAMTVSILTHQLWYAPSKAELDREIRNIIDRGEPLWFADLASESPADELHESNHLMSIFAKLKPLSDEFYELYSDDPLLEPGDYPVFRADLQANHQALSEIVDYAQKPGWRFAYDFETKVTTFIVLPHIDSIYRVQRLLTADVLLSLGSENHHRALKTIVDKLHVAELLQEDPFMICVYVRIKTTRKSLELLQTALAGTSFSDEQFQEIDSLLEQMEKDFRLRDVLIAERAALFTAMNNLGEEDFEEFLGTLVNTPEKVGRRWTSFLYRPKLMREQAFILRTMTPLAEQIDETGPVNSHKYDTLLANIPSHFEPDSVNDALFWSAFLFQQLRDDGLEHRQRLISARIGLRVHRYFRQNGKLPDTLNQVLDARLKSIPVGLFSEKQLVYKTRADGFSIHDSDPTSGSERGEFGVTYSQMQK